MFLVAYLLNYGVVLIIIESLVGLESLVERRSGVSL
jgi:hypothetical protein